MIVANKQNKPLNFEIEIDPLLYNKKLYVINQNRTIKADNTLSDILSNYAVNLYEFAEFTNYSIHKDNLIKDPGFENSVSVGVPNHCYAYAGSDKGSTYFVDSKEYYEGHHSLKIVTPTYYKGPRLNFHRINLKADQTYNVSVVAKGVPFIVNDEIEAPKFWEFWKWFKKDDEVTPKFTFNLKLSKYESRYFELTNEWKEYEFTIHTKKELKYLKKINTYLELIGKGKAWFDNLQVYKMQSETDTKN
ncbi:MAG: hypothetical protein U9N34_08735 [Candidatus Cloacimonadota bacterium]|nr:hypothetical protein [Candidatus Cloacimonadota bacterium]